MILLVGLGNPTPDSNDNRHNIGFKIIDAINQKFGLSKQKPKFKGLLTTGNIGNNESTEHIPNMREQSVSNFLQCYRMFLIFSALLSSIN